MNLIKKTTLVLGALAAAGTSLAQTARSSSQGLLGQRYGEFHYTLSDLDGLSDHGHATTLGVNLPVVPALLDVGAGYAYNWIGGPVRGHGHTLYAGANAYVALENVKPFVGVALGHTWVSLPRSFGDNDWAWNLAVGFEVPLGAFTVTPRITFADDFHGRVGDSGDTWTYEVEGNYWFAPNTGAFASIALTDYHRDPDDVWNYRVGLRFRF